MAANDFVTLARALASSNQFIKSFNMYMCAFYKDPEARKQLEYEFRGVLSRMNEQLAADANTADIFDNFGKAMAVFPGNVNLLNDIGSYLYRYGFFSEALCHFEKALTIDSSFAGIEKNLNNAKSFIFPRQLFRILNDKIRNSAYRAAIKSQLNMMDSVLDIDGGTGLLALYANERNPIVITACESSKPMARLAECVMQENNAQEVVIVNKPSVILTSTDIYGKRSVLLSDTFDAGLFGEYILQSLCHAWENLLYENGKVLPGRAEYFIAGIKCQELHDKYKLCEEIKETLNVTAMNVHINTYYGETYYGDDVHLYNNVKYMCEPKSLFTINFNSYNDVLEKLHRKDPYVAELTATEDGEVDAVIGWFNLHLTDEIMLTSDPRSVDTRTAYEQAVFFDVLPRTVRRNESISIPFTTHGGKLSTVPDVNVPITRVSSDTIAFLNDYEYMNMVKKSVGAVCVHLGQTVDLAEVNIVDLSPFPIFGLLMLRRGANSLICHAKTVEDLRFLQTVLVANAISQTKVIILVNEYWSQEAFDNKTFHVIFNQVLDLGGDVDVRKNETAQYLKHNQLAVGGICLPASVTLIGQLVSSQELEMNNRVIDSNVQYRMAKHVNRYQVSQALHLDAARLEYDALSAQFEVASCDVLTSDLIKVPVEKDGECNAILCWYRVQLMEHWSEIYTNRANSFVHCMAYMSCPNSVKVFKGDQANVLVCVDPEGPFKLVLDV